MAEDTNMEVDFEKFVHILTELATSKQELGRLHGRLDSTMGDIDTAEERAEEAITLIKGEKGDNGLSSRVAAIERGQKFTHWLLGFVLTAVIIDIALKLLPWNN